jgi:hypothetical protein
MLVCTFHRHDFNVCLTLEQLTALLNIYSRAEIVLRRKGSSMCRDNSCVAKVTTDYFFAPPEIQNKLIIETATLYLYIPLHI